MVIKNVTVGSDPELFIINKKTNKVVSSIGLIPGVKGTPWTCKEFKPGYGLEIDNILAEFNIPPAKNFNQFRDSINYMKDFIKKYVQKKNPDLDILCAASQIVDEDQLQSEEAKLFGCSVDYNAYTLEPNPKPQGEKTNLRSAGMHIHIGYDNPNTEASLELIRYMDVYLGVPSVLIDADSKRRILYGKAGCFRLTPYGLEYRVLSSYFMSSDELLAFVWKGVISAIDALNHSFVRPTPSSVIAAINNNDTKLAKEICGTYSINYQDYI